MLPYSRQWQGTTPRAELFLGYSYLRAVPTLAPHNRMVWLNGGSTSIAFNFNSYLGLVADFGGFVDSELRLTGAGANPPRVADSGGTAFSYLGGPRLSYRRFARVTPFGQVLFGAIHASKVTLSGCSGRLCTPLPTENAFALTAGGGLDLRVRPHLAVRLIQAEYLMTRFADLTTGKRQEQDDIRLSTGLVYRFGGSPPPPIMTFTCAASPASVYIGDPISVSGTALNLNPRKTQTYTWSADGGKISGTTATANIDTGTASPGTYTARGHVSEDMQPGRSADCSATYTVMAFGPPELSCSANPSTVAPGDSSMITASATTPQNRPLTYSYSASQGTITGATSTATLNTSAVSPGVITVTCNVADDKGHAAAATTTVTVQTPQPPPAPSTQKLCSIDFKRDTRRPTRVDNEAKACLDGIALDLQRSPEAKLAIIGNATSDEGTGGKSAAQRAVNTRDYLVREKGVDGARIAVYTGAGNSKSVDTTLIPAGAALDPSGITPVDDSVKPVARKALAKRRHHAAHSTQIAKKSGVKK